MVKSIKINHLGEIDIKKTIFVSKRKGRGLLLDLYI
jgi:hypothetical protein